MVFFPVCCVWHHSSGQSLIKGLGLCTELHLEAFVFTYLCSNEVWGKCVLMFCCCLCEFSALCSSVVWDGLLWASNAFMEENRRRGNMNERERTESVSLRRCLGLYLRTVSGLTLSKTPALEYLSLYPALHFPTGSLLCFICSWHFIYCHSDRLFNLIQFKFHNFSF